MAHEETHAFATGGRVSTTAMPQRAFPHEHGAGFHGNLRSLHTLVNGSIVPRVAVWHELGSAVFHIEVVKRNQSVAQKRRMGPGDRPETIVLMQQLFGLAREYVEQGSDVYLCSFADHPLNEGSKSLIEEQVIDRASLGQQVVRTPGLTGIRANCTHLGNRDFCVECMANALYLCRREKIRHDSVALLLNFRDMSRDVQPSNA